jgi:hypothetical protein
VKCRRKKKKRKKRKRKKKANSWRSPGSSPIGINAYHVLDAALGVPSRTRRLLPEMWFVFFSDAHWCLRLFVSACGISQYMARASFTVFIRDR